ncbi:MAG TPA: serine/threonine-protein kinase [Actinomycetota bacterium]|nr:serine/threonine-protein kinase [Actinomycetota bacterium]
MFEHLAPGHLIGGRYRLERQLGSDERSAVWRATDRRLERQVAVRVFDPELDRELLQRQAGIAASLTHPRVVRLFDSGYDAGHFFVVTELVPAPLAWAGLPLSPEDAIAVGMGVGEALVYAHERGVAHGNLHPGNVMMSEQGAKVSEFGLTGPALQGRTTHPSADLRALGSLLYRALTGRDPGTPGERPLPAEPRGLSRIVDGLVAGEYQTAERACRDLDALRPTPPEPERGRRKLLLASVAVGAVLLAAAAVAATRLGERAPSGEPTEQPVGVQGEPYRPASLSDFDPLGDGRERRSAVPFIADGDPRTFWATERYSGGPTFSGLKDGVGVVIDLGSPQLVGRSQVVLVQPGCSFEIRHAPRREGRADRWTTVAVQAQAAQASVVEFPATRDRWWLLWITQLVQGVPGSERSWACGVSEVALYPP